MRKSSFGLFSMARTIRLIMVVHESQRDMLARKKVRETINTTRAPASDAQYEMIAPVQAPKVYPDKIMSVEYKGRGAGGVRSMRRRMRLLRKVLTESGDEN